MPFPIAANLFSKLIQSDVVPHSFCLRTCFVIIHLWLSLIQVSTCKKIKKAKIVAWCLAAIQWLIMQGTVFLLCFFFFFFGRLFNFLSGCGRWLFWTRRASQEIDISWVFSLSGAINFYGSNWIIQKTISLGISIFMKPSISYSVLLYFLKQRKRFSTSQQKSEYHSGDIGNIQSI